MTQRDRYLLGGAGLIAIVAAFWLLALHPKLQNLSTAKSNLAAAQANYQTARQQAQENAQARVQFPHTYATLAKLGKSVPVNSDQASLVYQLASASKSSRIKFNSIQLSSSGAPVAAADPRGPDDAAACAARGADAPAAR